MGSVEWFLTWLEQNRLPVPVIVNEVRQDRARFTFDGWPCLKGSVRSLGISVWAYRGEEPWDGIFDIDIQPIERDGWWRCGLCWDAYQKGLYPEPPSYQSAEALWLGHSFTPLATWNQEKLAIATGIALWDYDGALEAKLVFDEADAEGAIEVIRSGSSSGRISSILTDTTWPRCDEEG